MAIVQDDLFAPYLPRLAIDWWRTAPDVRARAVDGSLVGIDISGFTALSERLAARGKLGAEELILTISRSYERLIEVAAAHGGDVLKFRGDALLVFFGEDGHELRACSAVAEMQSHLGSGDRSLTPMVPVELSMAAGVFSGTCHFFLVGGDHRELIVAGPAATATLRLEDLAVSGEVLVSPRTAHALPPGSVGPDRGGAHVLRQDGLTDGGWEQSDPGEPAVGIDVLVPPSLRQPFADHTVEAEHRRAAVAFLKFTGADALVSDLDEATAALDELARTVGDLTAGRGVTWLESDIDIDGGKIYLVSGAPVSAGGDEERMLRALRAIIDAAPPIALSAGANRGPVFAGAIGSSRRRTYAVMGDTVNIAARLAARAQPGQILASEEVLKRSRARFEATAQPFLVKGKERPITAYWLGALVDTAGEAYETLPLVGRERELAVLRGALDGARRRTSALVELVGEPGIGKSRLVEELQDAAVGFQQLLTRSEEYESSTPFFAFRSLLRPLAGITPELNAAESGQLLAPWVAAVMPDLAPWLPLLAIPFDAEVPPTPETTDIDPAHRQQKLHEVLEQFLERMLMMPTLLVFEDAHWMDDASEFFLRHLTRRQAARPWLICVTRRSHGVRLVRDDNGETLELGPLDADAAATLALAAAGATPLSRDIVDELTTRAGGNPLFVRELVASGADAGLDALPETVETVITARIDTLDPVDRLLLRCASVIGPSFDLDLLGEILSTEVAEAGEYARWLRLEEFIGWEDASHLRFRHDLFRAVSYEGLSYARRRQLHRLVGQALERRSYDAGEEAAGLLSFHFLEAGEHDKAWGYAVAAGDRARTKFANVDAAQFYDRALSASAFLTPDPAEVARIHEALGDVCEVSAHYDRAQAAYGAARTLVGGDAVAQTRLRRKEGILLERLGRYEEALAWYLGALEAIKDEQFRPDDEAERAELELELAVVLYRQGQWQECMRWSERAVEHARISGDRRALAHAYRLLDAADRAMGGLDPRWLELALPIYDELGDLLGKAITLNNLGVRAYFGGNWDEAAAYYAESREAEHGAGDVVRAASALNNEAEILLDQGHLERATAGFEEALRVYRASGYTFGVGVALTNLGRVSAAAGRFAEAHTLFDEALRELEAIGAESFMVEATTRRAECLVFEGRHAEARALAEETLERSRELQEYVPRGPILHRLLGYAYAQGRQPEAAREQLELALRCAREAKAEFELALTMRALAATGADEYAGLADVVLQRLGVTSIPYIPLP